MMYIVIPIYLYNWVIDPILLNQVSRQIIHVSEIRIIVNLSIVYIIYKLYKRAMSILFGKLQLNLKAEWIDYLTFKGWKIRYYKDLSMWLSVLNAFCTRFANVIDYVGKSYTLLFNAFSFF